MEKDIELGIVKWYGGYNYQKDRENNFGFIQRVKTNEDVFVHESQLLCAPKSIYEGALVTFKVAEGKKKGKLDATHVNLADMDNDEVMWLCFNNPQKQIWKRSLEKVVSKVEAVDDQLAAQLEEKFKQMTSSEYSSYIGKLPKQAFYDYAELRARLDATDRLVVCNQLYEDSGEEKLIDEIKNVIENRTKSIYYTYSFSPKYDTYWDKVSNGILFHEKIWSLVPELKKYSVLIQMYDVSSGKQKAMTLKKIVDTAREGKNPETLPEPFKKFPGVFELLKEKEQIELAWDELSKFWDKMSRNAKILTAFRAIKEKKNLFIADYMEKENDSLVKCSLYLVGKRLDRRVQMSEVHRLIETYVTSQAWESTEPLDLGPFFPGCPYGHVTYCEARKWKVDEDSGVEIAYCPRTHSSCPVKTSQNVRGAHIYPIPSLDWNLWTLTEVLDALDINPRSPRINGNDFYIMKIAGWINRLNEIRLRMKCKTCEKTLLPNTRYAFRLAGYNSTVAYCPDGHEQVYFNHCWNCHYIIDSRESRIKQDGLYLCIKCGCGPQEHQMKTPFKQGDKCPSCGTADMKEVPQNSQLRKCRSCNHKIHLKGKIELNTKDSYEDFVIDNPFNHANPFF